MAIKNRILQIKIENFMTIGNAVLDFDSRNILNLKGYSDSGKTAILIAIAVCLNNINTTKQLKYIKHGCKFFRIEVNFSDGVSIVRAKYSNGQSYYEMFKGGSIVYTTKSNDNMLAVNGIPEVISNYLEMANMKSGILNFRTNRDKLFLSETTGRENFEDLNTLFGIDDLLKALSLCKEEISNYKQEFQKNEVEIDFLKDKVKTYQYVKPETLKILQEEAKKADLEEKSLQSLKGIFGGVSNLNSIQITPQIEPVKSNYAKIGEIAKLSNLVCVEIGSEIPVVSGKNLERISAISSLVNGVSKEKLIELDSVDSSSMQALLSVKKVLSDFGEVASKVDNISFSKLTDLEKLFSEVQRNKSEETTFKSAKNELDEMKEKYNSAVEKLKEKGISVFTCRNCGSVNCGGVH